MTKRTYAEILESLNAEGDIPAEIPVLAKLILNSRVRVVHGSYYGEEGRVASALSLVGDNNDESITEYAIELDSGERISGLTDDDLQILSPPSGTIHFDALEAVKALEKMKNHLQERLTPLEDTVVDGEKGNPENEPAADILDPKTVKRRRKLEKRIRRALRMADIQHLELYIDDEDDPNKRWETVTPEWFAGQLAKFMDISR